MDTHIRESQMQTSPESVKSLRESIKTIKTLQKKYGDKTKKDKLLNIIKEVDKTTHDMLSLLIKTNNYKAIYIETLYQLIKKHKQLNNKVVEVKVVAGANTKSIEEKYGDIEKQQTTQIGISIKKGDTIYKRDLENDITKLLS